MTRLLLLLALMCENVNAEPQVADSARIGCSQTGEGDIVGTIADTPSTIARVAGKECGLTHAAGAAPFMLAHPLCQTGFMLKQRIDERDSFGIIIKRQWKMTDCVRVPRIVYGRKDV